MMNVIVLLAAATVAMIASSGEAYKCRVSEQVTRCVEAADERIAKGGYKWCEYRVCAFSFVEAVECDENVEIRATHECRRELVDSAVWRCLEGIAHEYFVVRKRGCEGDGCMESVRACACQVRRARRYKLEAERALVGVCAQ